MDETQTEQTAAAPEKPLWRQKIDASRRIRKTLAETWKRNVDYRVGKPFKQEPEVDTVNVPIDWARTKNKQAQLFFQVPAIKMRARQPEFMASASTYASALNFELEHEVKAYHMMDEVLADVINASGLGVAMVGYDATTEPVELPKYTPEMLQAPTPEMIAEIEMNNGQVPVIPSERVVYQCYYAKRVSPNQFLFPADFVGSDWQKAEWLGYDGRITLAEAKRRQWVDDSYETECGDKLETVNDTTDEKGKEQIGKYVKYAEVFYRPYFTDPNEKDPRKIHHLVLVDGKDAAVKDEPLKWQQYNQESRSWVGLTTFPIKVLTLTTVSDQAIPPSDSEIGRPQVNELIKSRSQMLMQRDRSLPLRWFDANQFDEDIAERIRKGTYQDMIPVNGPGDQVVGEIARANYPRENFEFQNVITHDLDEGWSMGPNQQGFATPGDTSATEANIIQSASNVRLDYERARVLRFFLEVAEAVGALMQLFQDDQKWIEVVGQNGATSLQSWDKTKIRGDYIFEAKPDAAVRVDVGQKRVEGLNLYKLLRRDPMVNGQALVSDILELHGFDPTRVMVPPPPPEKKPAALRFTYKGEDLANPVVVALIQKNSPEPLTPADIQAALALQTMAGIPAMPPQMMPLPQPGQNGQPPSPEQLAADGAAPGPVAEHPGIPEQVDPLGQRYERNPNQGADA
jgi:hypothetical protein